MQDTHESHPIEGDEVVCINFAPFGLIQNFLE